MGEPRLHSDMQEPRRTDRRDDPHCIVGTPDQRRRLGTERQQPFAELRHGHLRVNAESSQRLSELSPRLARLLFKGEDQLQNRLGGFGRVDLVYPEALFRRSLSSTNSGKRRSIEDVLLAIVAVMTPRPRSVTTALDGPGDMLTLVSGWPSSSSAILRNSRSTWREKRRHAEELRSVRPRRACPRG